MENIQDICRLAPMQKGMLFHILQSPQAALYFNQSSLPITGEVDEEAFGRAWQRVVDRHSVLRTGFLTEDLDEPVQVVHRQLPLPIEKLDWRALPPAEQDRHLHSYLESDRQLGFDLTCPPLMRVALIRIADRRYQVVWSFTHLILDGWCIPLLFREVLTLYEGFRRGEEPRLPPTRPYGDYIGWLEQQSPGEALQFWQRLLRGFESPTPLPFDRQPAPAEAEEYAAERVRLPQGMTAVLETQARGHGVTLATLLQGAWGLLLARYSGQDEVVFGLTVSGRPAELEGIESMMGLFINTLPVRIRWRSDRDLTTALQDLQEQQVEARRFEHTPLVEIQAASDVPRGTPLFDSVLVFQNQPGEAVSPTATPEASDGVEIGVIRGFGGTTNVPLILSVHPGASLQIEMAYDPRRFLRPTVARLLRHLSGLVERIAGNPGHLPPASIPLLSEAERFQILREWSRSAPPAVVGICFHRLFEACAARFPEAAALLFEGRATTYAELNARADLWARHLRLLGVGPEIRVGLCLERSPELVTALLAILKAGGAYVPLDPEYPEERLASLADDAELDLVVTEARFAAKLRGSRARLLEMAEDFGGEPVGDLEGGPSPEHAAYVIYTSGSTGRPKGVVALHRSLANFTQAMVSATGLGPGDRFLEFATLSFDASAVQIFPTLASGATLVLHPNPTRLSTLELAEFCRKTEITVLDLPAALWRQWVRDLAAGGSEIVPSIRLYLTGGESVPTPVLREWAAQVAGEVGFLTSYGPTEATVTATLFRVAAGDASALQASTVPLGRPLPGVSVYLLDTDFEPVPPGVPGHLLIGGEGISRGYLGRPDLTAERYLPDSFAGAPGARLYDTGDLARFLPDGNLEFLGRVDDQLKVRGFRIEPGEIEAALRQHPEVKETVVLARKNGDDARLIAYVVPQEGTGSTSWQFLGFLRERLPEHMLPSVLMLLERLPLTPGGKVDRRALPIPQGADRDPGEQYAAPRTPIEELLAGIWAEVLGVPRVGRGDGFFELGGHSLMAMRAVSRIREVFRVELPLRTFFELQTLERVSSAIERERLPGHPAQPPLVPVPRDGPLPLSFAQQRVWFIDQLGVGSRAYNMPVALRAEGALDLVALRWSLTEIVRRHEALRTTFEAVGGDPVQVLHPPRELSLPLLDLSGLPDRRGEREGRRLAAEEASRPFDLVRGPLFRGLVVRLAPESHFLLVTVHHLVSDGWSMGILVREVAALYKARGWEGAATAPLPGLPVQYADYAHWQRQWLQGEVLERQMAFWRDMLAGAPPVSELPLDRPRPALQTLRGSGLSTTVGVDLTQNLLDLCRQEGVTLFMGMLALFQMLLSRLSGQDDVSVGVPIAGRNRTEVENLIGFFANTLVLRTRLDGDPGLREVLARVREMSLGAYIHQEIPFEKLVKELQPERSMSHSPLFQVMFAMQNAPAATLDLPSLLLEPLPVENDTVHFDLILFVVEQDGRMDVSLRYNSDLFDGSSVVRVLEHLKHLLASTTTDPDRPLSTHFLLSEAELHQVVFEWTDTAAPYEEERRIEELFEEQVERRPDAVAVVFEGRVLTYRELDRRANRLAHLLRELGVGPEVRVAVHLERSAEMVIAVLGILKAGGAYIPLDLRFPNGRIQGILEAHRISGVVTLASRLSTLSSLSPLPGLRDVVCLDRPGLDAPAPPEGVRLWSADDLETRPMESPEPRGDSESLAYVIFTSGSTGAPKGVMIRHRPVVNLIQWVNQTFGIGASDRVLFTTALSFDLSVYDIFGLLAAGGSVRVASEPDLRDPEALVRALCEEPITFWDSAPAALEHLAPFFPSPKAAGERPLRLVFLSGDWIPVGLPDRMRHSFPKARVISLGGATEATVWSNFHSIDRVEPSWLSIPYGRPIRNARYHILDERLQPSPIGVAGDLFIAGECLSAGYLDEPVLTSGKYIPDPFSSRPGDRLYRTGDRARFWADGTMEFLGRVDHQVKIRGFRIELGEIDSVLSQHPAVRVSATLAWQVAPHDKRMVAYVVPAPGKGATDAGLRAFLQERLPDYMIPAAFVFLEELPVTSNGKLDRQGLPAPSWSRPSEERGHTPLRTPSEEVVAAVWAAVLDTGEIAAADNFFDLGGQSLLATQVIARLRDAFKVELPLRVLFEQPTVRALAAAIDGARREERGGRIPPLVPVPRGSRVPLSFAQQRIWFLDQLDPLSPSYNLPAPVRMRGPLSIAALRRALEALMGRHESLRTTFESVDGEPVQVLHATAPVPVPVFDLRNLGSGAREGELNRLAQRDALAPFDLKRLPLFRLSVVCLAEAEHALLLTMHHIISDGWSMGVLVRELGELYESCLSGRPAMLPDLAVQYADHTLWQRSWLCGEVLEGEVAFWRWHLGEDVSSVLELPTDRPRPPVKTFAGAVRSVSLPGDALRSLHAAGRQHGVTLFMTFLAGFQILMARYSGRRRVAVGTPVAGRSHLEMENLIGFFVNTLVLATDLSGDPPLAEILQRARETTLEAHRHQDLPFEKLVEELQPQRGLSHTPLTQVMLVLQNALATAPQLGGSVLMPLDDPGKRLARYDLTVLVEERQQSLAVALEYNTDLFDTTTADRILQHLTAVLAAIRSDTATPLSDIPLLAPAELHQILVEWQGAEEPATRALCVHHLFAERARQHPDRLALIWEGGQLSYGELDRRSSQLAHHLRSYGVGPETLVGLCYEQSPEMLIALLGILKSGGAYVPLDPAYPPERLAYMVQDSRAALLLTRESLLPRLIGLSVGGCDPEILCLDTAGSAVAGRLATAPVIEVLPSNSAYVIYTSGSTGRPKGVVAHHGGLSNFSRALASAVPFAPDDRVLLFASFSFDASAVQIYPTLISGAALVIQPGASLLSGAELMSLCQRLEVTLLDLPAGLWKELLGEALASGPLPSTIRKFLTGGESFPSRLLADWARSLGREACFLSSYGPTEATVTTTYFRTDETGALELEQLQLPLGKPLHNCRLHLLGRDLEPVPLGVCGEIWVAGAGLTRGYLGRSDLTADRFRPDPLAGEPGARLYRTGDLARRRPDGELQFLGRVDHQVKIRGYRVELGEVEAAIGRFPGVRQSVAIVREDAPGDRRLVAYVVLASPQEIRLEGLRSSLQELLPEYMVPSSIVVLEQLPIMPSGKVDLRALPSPAELRAERQLVPPRDDVERRLLRIFEDLLRISPVGVTDDFFALGGHSLLAVRLMARIQKELACDLPLATLFAGATVEQLAQSLRRRGADGRSPLVSIQPQGSLPPFFCVHPIGGQVLAYLHLARRLSRDQPFYGLQAAALSDGVGEPPTLEAMAAEYLQAVRTVQPHGPYFLGGWSFGGAVAFEMAQELVRQGEAVALLALLDGAAPGATPREEIEDGILLVELLREEANQRGVSFLISLEDVKRRPAEEAVSWVFERAKEALIIPQELDLGWLRRFLRGFRDRSRAFEAYRPRPYSGKAVFFRAEEEDPDLLEVLRQAGVDVTDPTKGWANLTTQPIEVEAVPGSHEMMMQEPYVRTLAERLAKWLESARITGHDAGQDRVSTIQVEAFNGNSGAIPEK